MCVWGVCEYAYMYVCMFVNVRLYDAMYWSIVVLREKGDHYLDLLIISPSRAGAIEPRPTKVTGNNADRYPKMNPSWPPMKEDPNPKTVAITCWQWQSLSIHTHIKLFVLLVELYLSKYLQYLSSDMQTGCRNLSNEYPPQYILTATA